MLSDSFSLEFEWQVFQVSTTLRSILTDINNAAVWMISALYPLISKSSSPFINPSMIVPREPISIGITTTFIFHIFSIAWQGLGTYPSFYFFSTLLCGQPGLQSPQFGKLSFLLIITMSGNLADIRWSVCISKSQRSLCVSFSRNV